MNNGLFITLEGGEGAGKSTQAAFLKEYFEKKGQAVLLTREPGGTVEAEKIRNLIVDRNGGAWDAFEETLLLFTARYNHLTQKIKPALAKNMIVICDRFTDSTIAYQGYGHGLSLDKISDIQKLTIGDFAPTLTFLFDLSPEIGLQRSHQRMAHTGATEDRFEKLNIEFHNRLRAGFLNMAEAEPNRFSIINAAQSIEVIQTTLLAELSKRGL